MKKQKSTWVRLTALGILIVFFTTQGAPYAFSAQPEISIPAKWGSIEEYHRTSSPKTVIYIQDAHDSLEAQESIAGLIGDLTSREGVKTVYEEGYEGPVPTDSYFAFIRDPKIRRKVSFFFLDKLRIGGAEFAHINRKHEFKLIGADSIQLHLKNVHQAQREARHKEEIEEDLGALSREFENLGNKIFPEPLKEWKRLRSKLDAEQIDLAGYLQRAYPLLRNPRGYRLIPPVLRASLANDPAALAVVQEAGARELFREIDAFENDLAESLLKNPAQIEVFRYQKDLMLLQRLNELKVTPPEYEAVKDSLKNLKTEEMAGVITREAGKSVVLSKAWEENILQAAAFYEIARARDRRIEETLDAFLKNPEEEKAVLVFGGFHKSAIREFLKRRGISYLVVTPKFSGEDPKHQAYYNRLMSAGHYPFEVSPAVKTASRPEVLFTLPSARSEIRDVYAGALESPDQPFALFDRAVQKSMREGRRPEVKELVTRSEMRGPQAEASKSEIIPKSEGFESLAQSALVNIFVWLLHHAPGFLRHFFFRFSLVVFPRIAKKGGAELLEEHLFDDRAEVRFAADRALQSAGRNDLREKVYADPRGSYLARIDAFRALMDLDPGEALIYLADGNPPVRRAVIGELLKKPETRGLLNQLEKILRDRPYPWTQLAVIEFLHRLRSEEAVRRLFDFNEKGLFSNEYAGRTARATLRTFEIPVPEPHARSEMRTESYGVLEKNGKLAVLTKAQSSALEKELVPQAWWTRKKNWFWQNFQISRTASSGQKRFLKQQQNEIEKNIRRLFTDIGRPLDLVLYVRPWPSNYLELKIPFYHLEDKPEGNLLSFRDSSGKVHLPVDYLTSSLDPEMQHALAVEAVLAALAPDKAAVRRDLEAHALKTLFHSPLFSIPSAASLEAELAGTGISLLDQQAYFEATVNLIAGDLQVNSRILTRENETAVKRLFLEKTGQHLQLSAHADPEFLLNFLSKWFRPDVALMIRDHMKYGKKIDLNRVDLEAARGAFRTLLPMLMANAFHELLTLDSFGLAQNLIGGLSEEDRAVLDRFSAEQRSHQAMLNRLLEKNDAVLLQSDYEDLPRMVPFLETAELPRDSILSFPFVERDGAESSVLFEVLFESGMSWKQIAEVVERYLQTGSEEELYGLSRESERFEAELSQLAELRRRRMRGEVIHFFPAFAWRQHEPGIVYTAELVEREHRAYLSDLKAFASENGNGKVVLLQHLPEFQYGNAGEKFQKPDRNTPDRFLSLMKEFYKGKAVSAVHVVYNLNFAMMGKLYKILKAWRGPSSFAVPVPAMIADKEVASFPKAAERYIFGNFSAVFFDLVRPRDGGDGGFEETPAPEPSGGAKEPVESEEELAGAARSEMRSFHKFIREKPVVRFFDADAEIGLAVNPNAFDETGKSRFFFDRIGNKVLFDGKPLTFEDPAANRAKWTVDELAADYTAGRPGYEAAAALPGGNLGFNDWFTGIIDGKVYHYSADDLTGRTYDMLVTDEDGHVRPMSLKFRDSAGRRGIFDQNGKPVGKIRFAVYGQHILKHGKVNVDETSAEFDDVRHLLRLPMFAVGKRQLHLGVSDGTGELYGDKDKLREAVEGKAVSLSLAPLEANGIGESEREKVFHEWGYENVTGKKKVQDLLPGEYRINAAADRMEIRFLPGVHPHSFFGLAKDGRLIAGVVPGLTHYRGAALKELAKELADQGAEEIYLWVNGKDSSMTAGEEKIEAEGARQLGTSAVIIGQRIMRSEMRAALTVEILKAKAGSFEVGGDDKTQSFRITAPRKDTRLLAELRMKLSQEYPQYVYSRVELSGMSGVSDPDATTYFDIHLAPPKPPAPKRFSGRSQWRSRRSEMRKESSAPVLRSELRSLDSKFLPENIYDPEWIREQREISAKRPTIVFDLWGTLGYRDEMSKRFVLRKGIEEEIKKLKAAGARLILWTDIDKRKIKQYPLQAEFQDLVRVLEEFDWLISWDDYPPLMTAPEAVKSAYETAGVKLEMNDENRMINFGKNISLPFGNQAVMVEDKWDTAESSAESPTGPFHVFIVPAAVRMTFAPRWPGDSAGIHEQPDWKIASKSVRGLANRLLALAKQGPAAKPDLTEHGFTSAEQENFSKTLGVDISSASLTPNSRESEFILIEAKEAAVVEKAAAEIIKQHPEFQMGKRFPFSLSKSQRKLKRIVLVKRSEMRNSAEKLQRIKTAALGWHVQFQPEFADGQGFYEAREFFDRAQYDPDFKSLMSNLRDLAENPRDIRLETAGSESSLEPGDVLMLKRMDSHLGIVSLVPQIFLGIDHSPHLGDLIVTLDSEGSVERTDAGAYIHLFKPEKVTPRSEMRAKPDEEESLQVRVSKLLAALEQGEKKLNPLVLQFDPDHPDKELVTQMMAITQEMLRARTKFHALYQYSGGLSGPDNGIIISGDVIGNKLAAFLGVLQLGDRIGYKSFARAAAGLFENIEALRLIYELPGDLSRNLKTYHRAGARFDLEAVKEARENLQRWENDGGARSEMRMENPYSLSWRVFNGLSEENGLHYGELENYLRAEQAGFLEKKKKNPGLPKKEFLVIGPGGGRVLFDLDQKYGNAFNFTGVNKERISLPLREILHQLGVFDVVKIPDRDLPNYFGYFFPEFDVFLKTLPARIRIADMEREEPFAKASFDGILVAREVYPYIFNKLAFTARVKELLKPEGTAFISSFKGFRFDPPVRYDLLFDWLNRAHPSERDYIYRTSGGFTAFGTPDYISSLQIVNGHPDIPFPSFGIPGINRTDHDDTPPTYGNIYTAPPELAEFSRSEMRAKQKPVEKAEIPDLKDIFGVQIGHVVDYGIGDGAWVLDVKNKRKALSWLAPGAVMTGVEQEPPVYYPEYAQIFGIAEENWKDFLQKKLAKAQIAYVAKTETKSPFDGGPAALHAAFLPKEAKEDKALERMLNQLPAGSWFIVADSLQLSTPEEWRELLGRRGFSDEDIQMIGPGSGLPSDYVKSFWWKQFPPEENYLLIARKPQPRPAPAVKKNKLARSEMRPDKQKVPGFDLPPEVKVIQESYPVLSKDEFSAYIPASLRMRYDYHVSLRQYPLTINGDSYSIGNGNFLRFVFPNEDEVTLADYHNLFFAIADDFIERRARTDSSRPAYFVHYDEHPDDAEYRPEGHGDDLGKFLDSFTALPRYQAAQLLHIANFLEPLQGGALRRYHPWTGGTEWIWVKHGEGQSSLFSSVEDFGSFTGVHRGIASFDLDMIVRGKGKRIKSADAWALYQKDKRRLLRQLWNYQLLSFFISDDRYIESSVALRMFSDLFPLVAEQKVSARSEMRTGIEPKENSESPEDNITADELASRLKKDFSVETFNLRDRYYVSPQGLPESGWTMKKVRPIEKRPIITTLEELPLKKLTYPLDRLPEFGKSTHSRTYLGFVEGNDSPVIIKMFPAAQPESKSLEEIINAQILDRLGIYPRFLGWIKLDGSEKGQEQIGYVMQAVSGKEVGPQEYPISTPDVDEMDDRASQAGLALTDFIRTPSGHYISIDAGNVLLANPEIRKKFIEDLHSPEARSEMRTKSAESGEPRAFTRKERQQILFDVLNAKAAGMKLRQSDLWREVKDRPGFVNYTRSKLTVDIQKDARLSEHTALFSDKDDTAERRTELIAILDGLKDSEKAAVSPKMLASLYRRETGKPVTAGQIYTDIRRDRTGQLKQHPKLDLKKKMRASLKAVKERRQMLWQILEDRITAGEGPMTPARLHEAASGKPGYSSIKRDDIDNDIFRDPRLRHHPALFMIEKSRPPEEVLSRRRSLVLKIVKARQGKIQIPQVLDFVRQYDEFKNSTARQVRHDLYYWRRQLHEIDDLVRNYKPETWPENRRTARFAQRTAGVEALIDTAARAAEEGDLKAAVALYARVLRELDSLWDFAQRDADSAGKKHEIDRLQKKLDQSTVKILEYVEAAIPANDMSGDSRRSEVRAQTRGSGEDSAEEVRALLAKYFTGNDLAETLTLLGDSLLNQPEKMKFIGKALEYMTALRGSSRLHPDDYKDLFDWAKGSNDTAYYPDDENLLSGNKVSYGEFQSGNLTAVIFKHRIPRRDFRAAHEAWQAVEASGHWSESSFLKEFKARKRKSSSGPGMIYPLPTLAPQNNPKTVPARAGDLFEINIIKANFFSRTQNWAVFKINDPDRMRALKAAGFVNVLSSYGNEDRDDPLAFYIQFDREGEALVIRQHQMTLHAPWESREKVPELDRFIKSIPEAALKLFLERRSEILDGPVTEVIMPGPGRIRKTYPGIHAATALKYYGWFPKQMGFKPAQKNPAVIGDDSRWMTEPVWYWKTGIEALEARLTPVRSELRMNVRNHLKNLKTPALVYLDGPNMLKEFRGGKPENGGWNEQALEIFSLASLYPEKIRLVISGVETGDERFKIFRELKNARVTSKSAQEAYRDSQRDFIKGWKTHTNLHLSKDLDGLKNRYDAVSLSEIHFFRYRPEDRQAGLLAAALLWADYAEAGKRLEGLLRDPQGFLVMENDYLRQIVSKYETSLVTSIAA